MTQNTARFVTKIQAERPQIELSLVQQGDDSIEIVATVDDGEARTNHCLGFFTDGKITLCVVGVSTLRRIGIQGDQLGRIVVDMQ